METNAGSVTEGRDRKRVSDLVGPCIYLPDTLNSAEPVENSAIFRQKPNASSSSGGKDAPKQLPKNRYLNASKQIIAMLVDVASWRFRDNS
ncbi:hypothetical protein NQZ68_012012 [Dissostichus eleginoides]|nr:hypothetical protein NQZ68_012012 [Dissostichus eleginoides]